MPQVRFGSSLASRSAIIARAFALLIVAACVATAASAQAPREACLGAHEQGQVARLRGHFTDARAQLQQCMQPACPRLLREDCHALLSDLDASRTAVVFLVADARGHELDEVRVLANDAPIAERGGQTAPLDPGTYLLRFEAPDHLPLEQTLVLREGEKTRVVRVQLQAGGDPDAVSLPPPAATASAQVSSASSRRGRRLRLATYVLGGAALAVLGTGIALGAKGKSEHDRLSGACGTARDCDRGDTEKGRSLYVAADVAFGVSGALAAAAITTFVLDWLRDDDQAPRRQEVGVNVQPSGASLLYRHAF